MSEQLASLHKKGGRDYGVNLFYSFLTPTTDNTWAAISYTGTVNDPDSTTLSVALDTSFGHINNGNIVVDKAIPKAYITGQALYGYNSSGTMRYTGVRMKKNGTVITGATVMGASGNLTPSFRRIETSFAVGDVITVEGNRTGNGGRCYINIITD